MRSRYTIQQYHSTVEWTDAIHMYSRIQMKPFFFKSFERQETSSYLLTDAKYACRKHLTCISYKCTIYCTSYMYRVSREKILTRSLSRAWGMWNHLRIDARKLVYLSTITLHLYFCLLFAAIIFKEGRQFFRSFARVLCSVPLLYFSLRLVNPEVFLGIGIR